MKNRLFYPILCTTTFVIGCIFFCMYHEWLIVFWNKPTLTLSYQALPTKKTILLYLPKSTDTTTEWKKEKAEIVLDDSALTTEANAILQKWISYAQEQHCLPMNVQIDSVCISPSHNELYINFTHNPLNKIKSAYDKYCLIESLLLTLRQTDARTCNLYLLTKHQPILDSHIDLSAAWPVQGFSP